MNFKIEYNFLDITNTPSIEKYFEEKANEGWLIDRIFLGSVFIFKKIEPKALDFSISPYEVENQYSRKTRSELKEFQDISELVGWTYVTESYDSHIYYKERGAEAIPIQTDEEEEFTTLEMIAKKRIKDNWFQVALFIFLGWFNIGGINTSPQFLKDGASQLILPVMAIGLTIAIWYIIHMKRFLKINRENIAQGKSIQYSRSLFLVPMFTFFLGAFFFLLITLYFIYLAVVLKNRGALVFFVILLVSAAIGTGYRFLIKPSKISLKGKKMSWMFLIVVLFFIGTWIGLSDILLKTPEKNERLDLSKHKVLMSDDFQSDLYGGEEYFSQNISFLIPKSYDYYYTTSQDGYASTEYGKALTKDWAINLMDRYIDKQKRDYQKYYQEDIELYLEEGIYEDYLLRVGLYENDLLRLKVFPQEIAIDMATDLIVERSIVPADEKVWNVDEIYYLSYDKDEVVIRNDREVFYLEGKDFDIPLIIEQTKEALGFN